MNDNLNAKKLESPLIIKNFVIGEVSCNYELYLIELLNSSNWFSDRFSGGFSHPPSESKGECDAVNSQYKIDFKLFESETSLMASSILNCQIATPAKGITVVGKCKRPGECVTATRIFAAFREKTMDELINIRNSGVKKAGIEKDIIEILDTLETAKNLLLFFPYEFYFDKAVTADCAIDSIQEALNNDFKIAFEYRKQQQSNLDTFFTCIYDKKFLIFKIIDCTLQFIESVNTEKLPTFKKLNDYTGWW